MLEELEDLCEHQRMSLTGKVQLVSAVEEVVVKGKGKKLSKQEFVFADCTAACRGVLWEEHINELKEGSCYYITNGTVRSFNETKYVSIGEKAMIKAVNDIGDVVDDVVFDENGGIVVVKGEVIGVVSVETYTSCVSCHGKVTETKTGVGQCSKCSTKVKMGKCKIQSVARVVIEEEGGKEHKLTMFGEIVEQIGDISRDVAGPCDDVSEQLLMSPQLRYTINLKKETVCSVTKDL